MERSDELQICIMKKQITFMLSIIYLKLSRIYTQRELTSIRGIPKAMLRYIPPFRVATLTSPRH